MKRVLIVALLAPMAAYAMTYYLQEQWVTNGARFCKYGNGTVLNVGANICPLSING
jgi:hypothetical protein